MKILVFLSAAVALKQCSGVSLPQYLKPCRGSDPDFNKCGLKSGKEAIKHLVHGEKLLRLVSFSPLKLPFVQLENRADFQMNISNVEIYGFDKADLVDFQADLVKREIKTVVHLPELLLKGQFQVDGRILVLPIKGNGPGTIKTYGGYYTYVVQYDLTEKGGKSYAKFSKDDFTFTIEKAEFVVEDLFGSDSILGKETMRFLNENWEEVIKDFDQVIGKTTASICKIAVSSIFEKVPFNELILP